MARITKQKQFDVLKEAIKDDVVKELSDRGLFLETDLNIIEQYAKEIAFAEIMAIRMEKYLLESSDIADHVRLARIRNAHLNTANQLARTLRIGPYGRDRFGKKEPIEQETERPTLRHLIPKRKVN